MCCINLVLEKQRRSLLTKTALLRCSSHPITFVRLNYAARWSHIFMELCSQQCNPVLGHFHHLLKGPLCPPAIVTPHYSLSPPPPLWPWQHLHSVPVDWPVLDISYKCSQTVGGLLWRASFTWCNVFKVHLGCNRHRCFIPFYGMKIRYHFMAVSHVFCPFTHWWTFEFHMPPLNGVHTLSHIPNPALLLNSFPSNDAIFRELFYPSQQTFFRHRIDLSFHLFMWLADYSSDFTTCDSPPWFSLVVFSVPLGRPLLSHMAGCHSILRSARITLSLVGPFSEWPLPFCSENLWL